MFLQAYIDDSSSEPTGATFVLAGFVSTAPAWLEFADKWQAELDAPPAIEYFKMTEAHALQGQFQGWDRAIADARTLRFAKIAQSHALMGLAGGLSVTDFNTHIRSVKLPSRSLATDFPYFGLFAQVILMMAEYQRGHGIQAKCDFIFDEQTGFDRDAVQYWPQIVEIAKKAALGSFLGAKPTFKSDRDFLPLQCADMYAWHMRRYFEAYDRGMVEPNEVRDTLIHTQWQPAWMQITHDQQQWMGTKLAAQQAEIMAANPGVSLLEAGKPQRKLTAKVLRKQAKEALKP